MVHLPGIFPILLHRSTPGDFVNKGANIGGNVYLEYKFLGMFTAKTDFAYNWSFAKGKGFTALAIQAAVIGLTENSLGESLQYRQHLDMEQYFNFR